MRQAFFLAIAVGYTAGVLYFSWTPAAAHAGSETMVLVKRWLFNLLHVPVYAGMMMAWYVALRARWEWKWSAAVGAAVTATVIGVVGELGQFGVVGRYPDVVDGTLNAAGACLGAWAVYHVTTCRRIRERMHEETAG